MGDQMVAANDFVRQWNDVRDDALAAVDRVGRSGWLVLGEEVAAFEADIAEWWGIPHAIGVASGLDAIAIGLRCVGVGPGDRVLTTPLTAFATTLAIVQVGAEPVWSDVDETGSLDLDVAAAAIREDRRVKALVPVHLYGHPLDPARLRALAEELEVAIVEDCAQSAGAERDGAPTGAAGHVAATSLYPTKNLGAMGDGGIVLTGDEEIAAHAGRLRNYGQGAQYEHLELGLNSRLDELQAAILRSAQLPRLDGHLARRREIAARYDEALRGTALRPVEPGGGDSARHLYPVEAAGDPDATFAALREAGVGVGRHYPFLCPDAPAAAGIGVALGELPVARRLAARELSLPVHPYLTDDEVEAVIAACREIDG
jgi:dTDP-3-amino-3,4,6-trideoxy-alpha-D-glucose transaminase